MSRPWFISLSFPSSYMNKLESTRTMLPELVYIDPGSISLLSTLEIQADRQLELNEMMKLIKLLSKKFGDKYF